MCTVLLPMGDNPIAVDKYIISYIISYHIMSYHISHNVVSHHIIYHIMSYIILSYHIVYRIIYHVISYHISYHISYITSYISYHIISYIISVKYNWILNRIQYNGDPNENDYDSDRNIDDLWVDPTKRVEDILGVFFGIVNVPLRLWFTSKVHKEGLGFPTCMRTFKTVYLNCLKVRKVVTNSSVIFVVVYGLDRGARPQALWSAELWLREPCFPLLHTSVLHPSAFSLANRYVKQGTSIRHVSV